MKRTGATKAGQDHIGISMRQAKKFELGKPIAVAGTNKFFYLLFFIIYNELQKHSLKKNLQNRINLTKQKYLTGLIRHSKVAGLVFDLGLRPWRLIKQIVSREVNVANHVN